MCSWHGVRCDGSQHVMALHWGRNLENDMDLAGTLSWSHLPLHVLRAEIFGHGALSGPLNLDQMPGNLVNLRAFRNAHTGSVDLTHLPSNLELLNIGSNDLSLLEVNRFT